MPVCTNCHRDAPDGAHFCAFCGSSITAAGEPGGSGDPLIGLTVGGKYLIHQLLGRGGMGDVYKATHLTLDRPVVLKLLKQVFHSNQSLVQRFHREARAASRLSHPNSITVIDFGQTDDGTLFMAMEYLAGRSLDAVIADEHPLAEHRVVHIGAQILAALSEAHSLGIIHRDLKPANVMIESRLDENDFVKVLDFGIAKLSESGTGGTGLTQTGIVCGTPGYMSPEQVRGEELDARSDLYAVGVILYEMITGLLPFVSLTPMGLVTKHLIEDPTPINVRNPGALVSPPLEAVVMRALARKRDERFTSAGEMRAALQACGPAVAPGQSGEIPAARPQGDVAAPSPSPTSLPGGSRAAANAPRTETPVLEVLETEAEDRATAGDVPLSRPDAAAPPRRKARMIGATFVLVIAAVASWGLATGRFGMAVGGAEASSDAAGPDPDVAAQRSDASPEVVPTLTRDPMDSQGDSPEDGAVAQDTAPAPASEEAPASPAVPDAASGPSVLAKSKPDQGKVRPKVRKGVRQVSKELNSIRTPSVSSGEGVLTVMASPWAVISIDGREIGETPREIRLGAGRYRVSATHPAHGTRERVVWVRPGKRQLWNPSFRK